MRPSLRSTVTLGFVFVVAALAIVLLVGVLSLRNLGSAAERILRENYRSVIACEDMNEALERHDATARAVWTAHDPSFTRALEPFRESFATALEIESNNITMDGEAEAVRTIRAEYAAYINAIDASIARADGDTTEMLHRFERVKNSVQSVLRMNQSSMEHAAVRAKSTARRGVIITLSVGSLAVLLAVYFAWRVPRTVVAPVQRLADAVRSVGEGKLDTTIPAIETRELAPLADAFRKMVAQLSAYRESSLGELLAAKDLANTTVQCLLDPVMVLDRAGGVLLTNDAAEQTFGLRPGSADELRASDVQIPAHFASVRDAVIASGEPVGARNFSEAVAWRVSGQERFFLVRAAPMRTEHGEPTRVMVIAQDVTRFRRIDDLKSGMVATVSHEFKTPLTSLRMATHMLLEPGTGPLTDTQREVVTAARDDTERLRTLVDELLDLVRIEALAGQLQRVTVDPHRLMQNVVDAHTALARAKGVSLSVEPNEQALQAVFDPEKMQIVLANLVSNAIRHTHAGGRVSLRVFTESSTLRIVVTDTGEGMPAQDLSQILDRSIFPRRDGVFGVRHGLGLMLAQEIVLQHAGEISMQSAVGRGTEVTVVLPFA